MAYPIPAVVASISAGAGTALATADVLAQAQAQGAPAAPVSWLDYGALGALGIGFSYLVWALANNRIVSRDASESERDAKRREDAANRREDRLVMLVEQGAQREANFGEITAQLLAMLAREAGTGEK